MAINLPPSCLPVQVPKVPENEEKKVGLHNPYLVKVAMVRRSQQRYVTAAFTASRSAQKSMWLQNPCLLGVAKVGTSEHGYTTRPFFKRP